MLTDLIAMVTKLSAVCREYERGGEHAALQQVATAARRAHTALLGTMEQLTVPMAIRDELAALDAHVRGLLRLLESMMLWPEISRATALMGCSMDLRTLNNAMRQLVESCGTARDFEELEVMLVAIAALLYALRTAASRREELLTPSMDFSSLRAVSRAHLCVLTELALGELRVRSDVRFSLEQWHDDADKGGARRYGYAFGDRRYAVRPEVAQRHGMNEQAVARAAMARHRDRAFEELPSTLQISELALTTEGQEERRASVAA
jgi:hypothetical protein